MQEMRVVYEIPGMERVSERKDITYKTVADTELKLDLYRPRETDNEATLPAVVFVHGAMPAWAPLDPVHQRVKDWGQYTCFGRLAAASGLIGICFNHRAQAGFTGMPAVAEDIEDLLSFMGENARELGVDRERIAIWSISMGVPFGTSVGLKHGSDAFRCLVAYYGPLDLRPLAGQAAGTTEDALAEFSPIVQLNDTAPPIFIARAEQDRILGTAINDSIDAFVSAARKKNIDVEMMNHPQGEHAFDVINNDARSREIIQRTLDFVRSHLEA